MIFGLIWAASGSPRVHTLGCDAVTLRRLWSGVPRRAPAVVPVVAAAAAGRCVGPAARAALLRSLQRAQRVHERVHGVVVAEHATLVGPVRRAVGGPSFLV